MFIGQRIIIWVRFLRGGKKNPKTAPLLEFFGMFSGKSLSTLGGPIFVEKYQIRRQNDAWSA